MSFKALIFAVPLLLLNEKIAHADASMECGTSSSSQVEIGNCVGKVEDAVDTTVQATLGFAQTAAEELDTVTDRKVATPALESAQEAWLAYRDTHCEYIGSTFGGGSGTSIAITSCRIELGRERIRQLMAAIN